MIHLELMLYFVSITEQSCDSFLVNTPDKYRNTVTKFRCVQNSVLFTSYSSNTRTTTFSDQLFLARDKRISDSKTCSLLLIFMQLLQYFQYNERSAILFTPDIGRPCFYSPENKLSDFNLRNTITTLN